MRSFANLPDTVAREILATLLGMLPPPVTDTPEARAAREENAFAMLETLLPANAIEANLATQIVAADAHAKDALRVAAIPGQSPEEIRRHRAQAASMARCMHSGLRELRRMQADREKAEAAQNPAAMERAGYWFRDCSVPAPPDPSQPSLLEQTHDYAARYTDVARRIRAAGGLTPEVKAQIEPTTPLPPPHIIDTLVNGGSGILWALDRMNEAAAAEKVSQDGTESHGTQR